MLKKLTNFLFSTRLMAVLFLVFAVAMAVGTFLDQGAETSPTAYSRTLVYNTWWFELIMILFVVNFLGNIFRYKLIQQKKWSVLLMHISFIFILIGAGITRYIGEEGVMPIKEGEVSNSILSDKVYFKGFVDGDYKIDGQAQRLVLKDKELMLSEKLKNSFSISSKYNQQDFSIDYVDFIENAENTLVEDPLGARYYKIVEAGGGSRHDHYVKEGSIENIHNVLFTFNKPTKGAINITDDGKSYATIETPFEGTVMRMADQSKSAVRADSIQPLKLLSLYEIGELQFVIPESSIKGNYKIVKSKKPNLPDALTVKVTSKGESKEVTLMGSKGIANDPTPVKVGGLDFYLSYGSKEIPLPFSIKLNDLIAERYPGTNPSMTKVGFKSYESKVTIEDDKPFDARIYMNNVLDHKGYRFFQASINFSTVEKEQNNDPDITVLSVNNDWWGTWISYLGYFLLFASMIIILFDRNTRFGDLKKRLKTIKEKKANLTILLLFISLAGFAQNETHEHHKKPKAEVDSIIKARAFPKEEAEKFGSLLIQDFGGRIKPVNTYATELLRKVSKYDTYEDLDANQVLLSMIQNPKLWYDVPLIKLKRGNDSIRKVLELPLGTKYAALADFYTPTGEPKIKTEWVKQANSINNKTQFQKDIVRAFEDQGLLSQAISGSLLRIYPVPGDDNHKWVSPLEISHIDYGPDSNVIKNLFPVGYYDFMIRKDYQNATKILEGLKKVQQGYSAEVMPSEDKVKAEILYNKYDVFQRLFSWYMYAGVLMLFLIILQLFYPTKKWISYFIGSFKAIIIILFILHLFGLIIRWYISGHAPWSDAYESMIYIAFATMLFGLMLSYNGVIIRNEFTILFSLFSKSQHLAYDGKKSSSLTIASTAFITSMFLMIAHWQYIDPAIANLQPVLDSYWLMIHVSIIVGSYGPFALGFILGLVALLLMILTTEENKKRMDLNIQELMIIIEQSLTIGLVMLTIGNFLGGMWANESWGRYWGWDPKETWALISIMVYAFVLHMRLVPGLRSKWLFCFASVLAFASILMTYFGVNFYLVGLHSYASGDKPFTPTFVFIIFTCIILFSGIAYRGYLKYYKK
ncbi:cytochrome c biogenesis protein CcsA [Pseudofulvibacter geojedonensis]|uniref:Cytochrome c biogenesis protein CcsA n=1 Tax=Pseudofulvibacter geojedonensis TaxID=1123758 RepID=A0ABW3HYN7_9FLAO